MPTFGGIDIFGGTVIMQANVADPPAVQSNTYAGQDGTEEIRLGKRGATTHVSGRLMGVGKIGLNAAEMLFRSYLDGHAYVLVDQFGNPWPWVKLESFRPNGRIEQSHNGIMMRTYTATFRHLIDA